MNNIKSMRIGQKIQKGYTLIEIMIVIGVIAMLAAFAIPAYSEYISSASISKVNSHYEEAVRVSKATYSKGATRRALGLSDDVPVDTGQWIDIYGADALAPGGGSAYSTTAAGIAATGAIGVVATASSVTLVMPQYGDFAADKTETITAEEWGG